MISTCLLKLRLNYHVFSPKVKIVADYIINYPEEVLSSNIVDLAAKIGVSQYSIINCVKAIGFNGYSDFKISLALESRLPSENSVDEDYPENSSYTALKTVMLNNAKLLSDSISLINPESLSNAVNLILSSDRISIYGIGFSSYAAQYLSLQLVQLGLKATALSDPLRQILESTTLTSRDLLIGFSCSGKSPEITEAFEIANRNNCATILVSSSMGSKISEIADIGLYTTSSTTPYPKAINNAIVEQVSISSALSLAIHTAINENHNQTSDVTEQPAI